MASGENTLTRGVKSARSLYGRYGHWGKKVSWAFIDQVLFAGSNFIVNWLILRWMPKEQSGAVIVAFTWFLLVQTFYEGIMLSPMSYYGAGKYQKEFKRYLGYVFFGHAIFSLVIACLMGIVAYFIWRYNSPLLGMAMAGAAVASPFLLPRGLIRQPFYILSKPKWSAIGSGVYLVTNILSTLFLFWTDRLTPFSALLGMGVAGLVTSVVQLYVLKPHFKKTNPESIVSARGIINDHWLQGKWSLSARGLSWISTNFGYLLLPILVGYGGSAALRATMNLVMPIFQTNAAMITLLTPNFVRVYNKEGKTGLTKRVKQVVTLVVIFTTTYFFFLMIFGKPLINRLYNGRYDSEVTLLFLFFVALLPVITTISRILDASLVSMGKQRLSFQSKIIPTILTVVLDILFVGAWGMIGIPIESAITAALTLLGLIFYFRNYDNPAKKAQPIPAEVPAQ